MIAFRLLEAISRACRKEITDISLEVSHYDFSMKGCKIVEASWRGIKGSFSDGDSEPIQDLPELEKGDKLKIKDAAVVEKRTKPPVLYTEAGLLSAMESAGKEIENEEERKALTGGYTRNNPFIEIISLSFDGDSYLLSEEDGKIIIEKIAIDGKGERIELIDITDLFLPGGR